MHLSEKFPVPGDIALLYDFVNSLDLRHYVEGGLPHVPSDGLATAAELQAWLFERGLATRKATLSAQDHCNALALRQALRSFMQLAPAERAVDAAVAQKLNIEAAKLPMILRIEMGGDRTTVVYGMRLEVRVDFVGCRILKKTYT